MNNKELKDQAERFIRKSNVMPLVHALEGGVIDLASLLIDFIDFVNKENQP